MGNSNLTNLSGEVTAAHKSILTTTNAILSNTASLFTSANEFLSLVQKLEKWSKEIEQKEEEVIKKEEEVSKKCKEVEERCGKMDAREKGLQEREQKLAEQEKTWKQMQTKIEQNTAKVLSVVQLNVGGQSFEVQKEILLQYKGSYFESMLSSEHSQHFNKMYFIPYNPKDFQEILDFMKTKRITEAFISKQEEMREHFAFFNIPFPELSVAVLPAQIHEWFPRRSFSPLYKASRNGFAKEDFHRMCDNKGATLSIIQSEKGFLFGGYSPIPWGTNTGRDDIHPDFFIFTLTNPHGIPPTQYKLKDKNNHSHYNKGSHISFGAADLRIAEYCADQSCESHSFFGYSYEDTTGKGFVTLAGEEKFKVLEIEVYLVI